MHVSNLWSYAGSEVSAEFYMFKSPKMTSYHEFIKPVMYPCHAISSMDTSLFPVTCEILPLGIQFSSIHSHTLAIHR